MNEREQFEACQTPLVDLLRGVPIGARLVIDDGPYSTHFIPVGKHCHDAADAIDRLTPPQASPATAAQGDVRLSDEDCDAAIERAGLRTLALAVPQNLALLRGLCREAGHTAIATATATAQPAPQASPATVAQEALGIDAKRVGVRIAREALEQEYQRGYKAGRALATAKPAPQEAQPVDMVLHCPACGKQHIELELQLRTTNV